MKKYVLAALIGMGFGFPITLLCMILFGGYNTVVQEFLIWMIASVLYGLLSVIMNNPKNEMPLPLSFGLHFFGCIVITMGAALLNGYIVSVSDILPILIPAFAIYIVICLICFLLMKKNAKEINKILEKR